MTMRRIRRIGSNELFSSRIHDLTLPSTMENCPRTKIILVALFLWNIAMFTLALGRAFTRPQGVHRVMQLLGICGAASAVGDVWMLAVTRVSWIAAAMALFFFVAGLLVFQSAIKATASQRLSLAFSADVPAFLTQSGIYKFVRHPFYLAYTMNWLGAAIASRHSAAWLLLALMFGFYFIAARREEGKFLRSPLKAEYENYCHCAGMFFPRLRLKS